MSAAEPMIARRKPPRAGRRGTAIVEFAVMLPILLTLMLLCVDFGRFAHYDIAVTNAARAGAAYGSSHGFTISTRPAWEAQVRLAVVDELDSNSWFDASKLTVPSPVVTQGGDGSWRVQVDVSYPFQTLLNWPFLPPTPEGRRYHDPLILHRAVVMRGTF